MLTPTRREYECLVPNIHSSLSCATFFASFSQLTLLLEFSVNLEQAMLNEASGQKYFDVRNGTIGMYNVISSVMLAAERN